MPATNKLIVKDKEWNDLIQKHKQLDGVKIKIGLFGNGKPDQNLAYRGAIMTYGIPKGILITVKMRKFLHAIGIHVKNSTKRIFIPQRPFMQNAVDDNLNNLIQFLKVNYILLIKDIISVETFLKRIGLKHMDQIKNSIRHGNYAKLHSVTSARKGSTKPLIANSEMLNGVKYKVEK